jgi:hypothetical protein
MQSIANYFQHTFVQMSRKETRFNALEIAIKIISTSACEVYMYAFWQCTYVHM